MKRHIVIAASLTAIAGVVWFIIAQPKEPTYKGQPASYWLLQLAPGGTNQNTAARAFVVMGSNAMPCIIQNLHARDSVLRVKAHAFAQRLRLDIFRYTPALTRQYAALKALTHVGPACVAAAPEMEQLFETAYGRLACEVLAQMGTDGFWLLAKALNSTNRVTREVARSRLTYSHADAALRLNILAAKLDDPSSEVRRTAARAFDAIPGFRTSAVLVLEPYLTDTDLETRRLAFTNICRVGTRSTVVPIIGRALRNSDEVVRTAATNALEKLGAKPTSSAANAAP